MIPAKAATLEEAYEVAQERFVATGIPQEVSTVFVPGSLDDALSVPRVDHFVITDKQDQAMRAVRGQWS